MADRMTRKTFFTSVLGFFGVAQAQQYQAPSPTTRLSGLVDQAGNHLWSVDSNGNVFIRKSAVINNQCPVCGTIAEPYVRQMYDENHGLAMNCKGNPNADKNDPSTWWATCDPPKMVAVGPMERMTRCKRCNAAFWQDAEK